MPLQLAGEAGPQGAGREPSLREQETVFRFINVPERPVPSLGRDFSAPVIINYPYSDDGLRHLLSHDSDPFNRWDAGQRLTLTLLLRGIADHRAGREVGFPDVLAEAFGHVLADGPTIRRLPPRRWRCRSKVYIAEQLPVIDPDAIHRVRLGMRRFLAERLQAASAG